MLQFLLILFIVTPGAIQDIGQKQDPALTKKRMQTIHKFYSLLNGSTTPTLADSYSVISPHTELELSVARDSLRTDNAIHRWFNGDSKTIPSLSFVRLRQKRHLLQAPPDVNGLPTFSAFPIDRQKIKLIFQNHPEALQLIFQFSLVDNDKIIDVFLNDDTSIFSKVSGPPPNRSLKPTE